MALQRELHLDVVAIVGREKVRTDEQKDDLGGAGVGIDLTPPFVARADAAIMPRDDESVPFEDRQMLLDLFAETLVFVSVRVKQLNRHTGLLELVGTIRSRSK